MSRFVYVHCPGNYSLKAASTSIASRAIAFAKECTLLEVSRVVAGSFLDVERLYSSRPGKKVLIDFRPGDIIQRAEEIGSFDAAVILVHNQDRFQYNPDELKKLADIVRSNNATISATTKAGREWLTKQGINVFSNIIRVPVRNPELNARAIQDILSSHRIPNITLWLSPAVRKNSYFGMLAVLEAIKAYGYEVKLKVISRYFSVNAQYLADYYSVGNVNIHELVDPTDSVLDLELATSHVVVLPSYDEGLNLPLYECARMGCEVIASDIEQHRDGHALYSHVKLISTQKRTVFGNKRDEIYKEIELDVPVYKDMVNAILSSLRNWDKSRERIKEYFKSGKAEIQPWRVSPTVMSSFLGIPSRRSAGRALLEII